MESTYLMSHWLDEYEKDDIVQRKLAREGECEQDVWIKPLTNGLRVISPYHCGTCDRCLERKAYEIQCMLLEHPMSKDIRVLIAKPEVVGKIVNTIRSADYARYPSADGKDYLFSLSGAGRSIVDADIDYVALVKRRDGTRKSGRLIMPPKKEELANSIQIANIRASGRSIAVVSVNRSITDLRNTYLWESEVNDPQTLEVYCNVASMKITKALESENALVFSNMIKVDYALPTVFTLEYKVEGFSEDVPF